MADIIQSGQEIRGDQPAAVTTNWTSATTANTSTSISVSSYNTISVAMHNTSTMTAGVLTFEVSPDNTNWFPIQMARIDSFTVESTYTLSVVADRAWSTSVDGFTNFRVRLSTAITGTGTATIILTAQTFAIEPIVNVGIQPTPGNGLTIRHLISAATTNATSVKASPGTLYGWYIQNTNAAARYVKFHNTASAPTAGSGVVLTIGIPANAAANLMSDLGIAFNAGIGFTTTTGIADTDVAAVALNDLNINIFYA
jgi:hypothetical protein